MTIPHRTYPSTRAGRGYTSPPRYVVAAATFALYEQQLVRTVGYVLLFPLYLVVVGIFYLIYPPLGYIFLTILCLNYVLRYLSQLLKRRYFRGATLSVYTRNDGIWEVTIDPGPQRALTDLRLGLRVQRRRQRNDAEGGSYDDIKVLLDTKMLLPDVPKDAAHAGRVLQVELPAPTADLPPTGVYRDGMIEWHLCFSYPWRAWFHLRRELLLQVSRVNAGDR